MSVNQVGLPVSNQTLVPGYRTLGAIGMVCAPALFVGSFFHSNNAEDAPNQYQFLASTCGALYIFGIISSAAGMRRLRVTGRGRGAAVLFAVQIVGLFLAMMHDVLELAAPELKHAFLFFVTDMAYPFSHLLLLVVGGAVWRAGAWRGWRLVPAFACGMALFLFLSLSQIAGSEIAGNFFFVWLALAFFTLGYAVKTSKRDERQ